MTLAKNYGTFFASFSSFFKDLEDAKHWNIIYG